MIIDVFTQSILLMEQAADCNYKVVSAGDFFDIHDVGRSNIALGEASNLFVLTDHVTLSKSIDVSASDTFVLSQSVQPKVIYVSAESHFVLIQEAIHERTFPAVFQALTLTDEAVAILAHGTYDSFTMSDEATYNIVKLVTAESQLALVGAGTVYIPDKMWIADSTLTVDAP